MSRYRVTWTEITHYTSEVDADSPEAAQELCLMNLGDWQDSEGGYAIDSIDVTEVEAR